MMLVTLDQARDHIRSDTDADDADLRLKIEAASSMVVSYLGSFLEIDSEGDPFQDSNGELIGLKDRHKKRLQMATLLQVAFLYRERDGSQEYTVPSQYGYGYGLCLGALTQLYDLRKPTVA